MVKNDTKIYTRHRIKLPKITEDRNKRKIIKILLILVIAITIVRAVLLSINPIIEEKCKTVAKSIATKISNEQATLVMAKYTYEDLINVIKDENGNIKMIGTNIISVNEIISDIPIKIQEELEKSENNNFNIKLGSFFGSKIFSGMGPNINIKIQLDGTVETDLKSEFTSQGINQTLHRIYLDVVCKVSILTPVNVISEEIKNQVLLVEGIIAGEIPESYYNLEGLEKKDAIEIVN
ncbi:MAG: sporulation protein YunB [Clostridia bacterium]|jgi:sporulation protein YunB|nr:sporulation protein YunB [Clostridia bacterium]CDE83179.1 putative sporulation protein YunB [Clostridium sp. CAG:273]